LRAESLKEHTMTPSSLNAQEIRYQISQIKEIPSLPQSVHRLIEIINDEVESAEELESIISYDQALTAKMLRIANSTYYGCRKKIRTLAGAILTIGLTQARSICLFTLLNSLLTNGRKLDPAHRERLWKHSFASSRIAAEIAKKRPWMKLKEAAILGLMHDIGHVVMAMHFREQFEYIVELADQRKNPLWCVEMQTGLSHTEIGKYLAARWALPEVFQNVIEFHHSPDKCKSFQVETKLIYLANILANSREFPELLNDEATLAYCRDLYISEEEWEEYQDGLKLIWPEVEQLWNLLS